MLEQKLSRNLYQNFKISKTKIKKYLTELDPLGLGRIKCLLHLFDQVNYWDLLEYQNADPKRYLWRCYDASCDIVDVEHKTMVHMLVILKIPRRKRMVPRWKGRLIMTYNIQSTLSL